MIASGLLFLIAQDKKPDPKGQNDYPRISCEELKKLIDTKATQDIVIVDNQPAESFDEGHIPGAVSFPWTDRIQLPVNLPRNKTLIMYCPCEHEEDSIDMADKLRQFGYYKIKLLEGGWFKWEELKYPIEKK
jgi:3-mercaptopyruvate sulfurtransferase SseA